MVCDDDKGDGNVYDYENSICTILIEWLFYKIKVFTPISFSNLTFLFQIRIAHFEDIKAANEAEAEKFEEQLRNIQKKMQVITIHHHWFIIIEIAIIINTTNHHRFIIREGVKKTDLFGTLSQTMGRWVQRWVQSPKLFSENNHSVIFTANIQKCPKTCNT